MLWVGNAKQAAFYYSLRLGFRPIAYRGLETGHRDICTYVMQQGQILVALQSFLNPQTENEHQAFMVKHISRHGDGVRDVAFTVDDATALYDAAIAKGATSIRPPWTEQDVNGHVVMASIATVSSNFFFNLSCHSSF